MCPKETERADAVSVVVCCDIVLFDSLTLEVLEAFLAFQSFQVPLNSLNFLASLDLPSSLNSVGFWVGN